VCVVDPDTALTTIVYVPAGVPVTTGGFVDVDPPPPHPAIPISTTNASANKIPLVRVPRPSQVLVRAGYFANVFRNFANHTLTIPPNKRTTIHPIVPLGRANTLAPAVLAVVDTLTVNGVALVPLTFTLDGDTAQLAAVGAPEHDSVTVPVNPATGASDIA
jgi:hypothetical protein